LIGASQKCVFPRLHIFNMWCTGNGTNAEKMRKLISDVQADIENNGYIIPELSEISNKIENLCKTIVTFWKNYKRTKSAVIKYQSGWLNTKESISIKRPYCKSNQIEESAHRGRPKLEFEEASERTKRRRVGQLIKIDESAVSSLRNDDRNQNFLPADPMEVISLLMETSMTKHQYLLIRNFVNSKISFEFFPSYQRLLSLKKIRYPDGIYIDESRAEVELQSLLDNTASSIIELQNNIIETMPENIVTNLTLIGKWGFDGSTGHSEYKQKFSNGDLDDRSLFVTSYVPLQLVTQIDNTIIWKNPRPSSTRYCRPIRFQFKKETAKVSKDEAEYFDAKIKQLKPKELSVSNKKVVITHSLHLTMVDGKVCNAISESSSATCYICGAKPTEMNNIQKCLSKEVRPRFYEFGLSPLHSYIRFFEYFLHISYKLEVKMWQVRDEEKKMQVLNRKKHIQEEFREKMGILVDKPRDGGRGSSNDGNIARKFFCNADLSSEITGIDASLIHRCATLLQAMASGFKINVEKFENYALDTAKYLIAAYPWYYLPATVHKVLIHGSAVIEYALVSIGELSEEAAESNNKELKKCRLQHSRKVSRTLTNTDVMNYLLLRSDPFLTGQRQLPKKDRSSLLTSVYELLDDAL